MKMLDQGSLFPERYTEVSMAIGVGFIYTKISDSFSIMHEIIDNIQEAIMDKAQYNS